MSRNIELLDESTIDKIAAGEVVERPASVIKELVENAIDALATAITVEIKDGGTTFMRITDNGGGIPADQVRTAFMRHATSKIRKVEDLENIASLGFRGEALSSIAAVSRMECITKTPDALTGVRYTIEGGKEKDMEEIGAPSGTTFIVRNLFYNVPARAKFMKSAQAEGSHCASCVEELALSHPEISFKFIMNGQNRLYTSGNGNLKEIVYQIYGRDLTKELIPVSAKSDIMEVHGFIGNPNASRGNRNFENYFINNRFAKNNVLTKAIEDGYHGFLMQHRYPFTLLYLDIDCKKVDVNVHPRKLEVRLSDQERLYHELCLAIQNALMHKERIPEVSVDREARKNPDSGAVLPFLPKGAPEPFERVRRYEEAKAQMPENKDQESSSVSEKTNYNNVNPYPERQNVKSPVTPSAVDELSSSPAHAAPEGAVVSEDSVSSSGASSEESPVHSHLENRIQSDGQRTDAQDSRPAPKEVSGPASRPTPEPAEIPEQLNMFKEDKVLSEQSRRQFRLIGQLFETYWLIEFKDSLYIIDQHAAHEKVNYERLMRNYREKKISSQMLYPGITLNLSARESHLIEKNMKSFTDLGFEIEPFGNNTFRVTAVPDNLYSVNPESLFTEILAQLEEIGDTDPKVITERIASMACKASVKGNTLMSEREAEALIDELLTLENPYNCPHGRPTIISMTKYEIDKKFKRIV
ncbi:MAG: DNA mismatch repair endonuclease MutL [Eubacteriales bacterium]|jgi:DNA mismatch repair protein MutL